MPRAAARFAPACARTDHANLSHIGAESTTFAPALSDLRVSSVLLAFELARKQIRLVRSPHLSKAQMLLVDESTSTPAALGGAPHPLPSGNFAATLFDATMGCPAHDLIPEISLRR